MKYYAHSKSVYFLCITHLSSHMFCTCCFGLSFSPCFEPGTHIYDFWCSRKNNILYECRARMAMQATPRKGHSLLTMVVLTYEHNMVLLQHYLSCSYSRGRRRHYLAMWSFWRKADYFCFLIYIQRACCKKFIKILLLVITFYDYTW